MMSENTEGANGFERMDQRREKLSGFAREYKERIDKRDGDQAGNSEELTRIIQEIDSEVTESYFRVDEQGDVVLVVVTPNSDAHSSFAVLCGEARKNDFKSTEVDMLGMDEDGDGASRKGSKFEFPIISGS